MKLWAVHPPEFLDAFDATGVLVGNWDRIDKNLLPAYQWMVRQMALRGVDVGSSPPVWAWYMCDHGKRDRPELTEDGFLEPGSEGVCIEFDAPDQHVVLSDFDMWHYPINQWYLIEDDAEAERIEGAVVPRAELEKSWERIFDLSFGSPAVHGRLDQRRVQATLPFLRREWVLEVQEFIAR